jgi:hypothetical protein
LSRTLFNPPKTAFLTALNSFWRTAQARGETKIETIQNEKIDRRDAQTGLGACPGDSFCVSSWVGFPG